MTLQEALTTAALEAREWTGPRAAGGDTTFADLDGRILGALWAADPAALTDALCDVAEWLRDQAADATPQDGDDGGAYERSLAVLAAAGVTPDDPLPTWVEEALETRSTALAAPGAIDTLAGRAHLDTARAIARWDREYAGAVEYLTNHGMNERDAMRALGLATHDRLTYGKGAH